MIARNHFILKSMKLFRNTCEDDRETSMKGREKMKRGFSEPRQGRKGILGILLCLMLVMGLFVFAQASVTTADSGPAVGKHEAQHYVMDCSTQVITNAATGAQVAKNLGELPFLYPGDTVEFQPSATKVSACVFLDSNGNKVTWDKPGADGQPHVHVISTAKFYQEDGGGKPLDNIVMITKVEIVGDALVKLSSGGSFTYFGPNHDEKGGWELKYRYVPMWCDIHTELWHETGSDHHQMTGAEAASAATYGESSTRAWAEDSITNATGATRQEVLLTLRRPYIEGRFFTGIKFDSVSGKNPISREYELMEGQGWHGNFWEGWQDNQVEVHPVMVGPRGSDFGTAGSYDDELLVRFKYVYGRTVTFDACGGTIDGYPSRIYEAEGRQYFNADLKSGKVDKDFAAGRAYVPVRDGYQFGGWYEDQAYKKPVTSIKETVGKYTENSTQVSGNQICRLYARWLSIVSLKDCKLSKIEDQVYTGKKIEPKLKLTYKGEALEKGKDYKVAWEDNKKIGIATVTITGKGRYTGTKTEKFQILPRAVELTSLQAGSRQLAVFWKQGKGIDGYQVEYGLKKDFKGAKQWTVKYAATTKITIKKLKANKTYYVRIRAFKKVKDKTYYSEWSKVKTAKPEK